MKIAKGDEKGTFTPSGNPAQFLKVNEEWKKLGLAKRMKINGSSSPHSPQLGH